MSTTPDLPFSEIVRVNELGSSLDRHLVPDAAALKRIARTLNLASLDSFQADVSVKPAREGWRLNGRVVADAVQTCGLTLEPLPVRVDETFTIDLVEAVETEDEEIDVDLDADVPDVIEDGRIDLGQYAVEQFALALDPFPRKPDAVFVQPEEPSEISPFAVLKAFKSPEEPDKG